MAEQGLDCGQIAAGFEQVGGEGVAERVDAARLGDAGAEFRHRVELLGDGDVDGAGALTIGKEQTCGGRMRQYARQSWSSRGESGT